MSFTSIPSFSLESIKRSDLKTIKDLTVALSTHGFFTITEHGISDEILTSSYAKSKQFFDLPTNKKNKYSHPEMAGARGYTPFGKETAMGETVPDLKEFWHHGPEVNESFDSRISPNISVDEISDFNKEFDQLFKALNALGEEVLRAIALILTKDKNFFIDDLAPHIISSKDHAENVKTIHFISNKDLSKLAITTVQADIRANNWKEIYNYIENEINK